MEKSGSEILMSKPLPQDFDKFLPWACKNFRIDFTIIIFRSQQSQYVSVLHQERSQQFKKTSKSKSIISTVSPEHFREKSELRIHDYSSKASTTTYQSYTPTFGVVKINTVYDNCDNLLQIKFDKNIEIPRKLLKVIGILLKFHLYLTNITINSALNNEIIYELNKLLSNSHITDVCLDGAAVVEGNYDILLEEENYLRHLSLARCQIDDDIVKKIALKLSYPLTACNTLSLLNLASNKITDLGASSLAEALRGNRQLAYLNLSDNSIADKGAMAILDVLDVFLLTDEELTSSKSRYMEYMKEKNKRIFEVIVKLQADDYEKKVAKMKSTRSTSTTSSGQLKKSKELEDIKLQLRNSPKSTRISHTLRKSSSKKSGSLDKMSLLKSLDNTTPSMWYKTAKSIVENKMMTEFRDHFAPKELSFKDDKVYCYGNNHLAYLNIAYNDISYFTVKRLLSVLSDQKMFDRVPRGLLKISIEGNHIPDICTEFSQIDDILDTTLLRFGRKSSVARKKRGTN